MFSIQAANPFDLLRREMDDVFYNTLRNWPAASVATRSSYPALNIWEDEGALYVEAEVPGLKQEQLEVIVLGAELTIKGKLGGEMPEKASLHRRERPEGQFTRIAHLPTEVDPTRVEAVLKNGVLTITLPKAEAARPRKISVNAH